MKFVTRFSLSMPKYSCLKNMDQVPQRNYYKLLQVYLKIKTLGKGYYYSFKIFSRF